MARHSIIDKATLLRYVREGLSQNEMAERFLEETGERRSRSTFATALKRHGIEDRPRRARYEKYVPWPHCNRHYGYELRMLRAYASRQEGEPNQDALDGRLDGWLNEMDREDLVILYHEDLGFFRVPREPGDEHYITVKNWPDLDVSDGSVRGLG